MHSSLKIRIRYLLFVLSMLPCFAYGQSPERYKAELESWHKKRLDSLKAPNGWLNLTGLFWLKPGKNSFGSAPSSDIICPDTAFPAHAGFFELEDNRVSWTTENGTSILLQDKPFNKGVIYQTELVAPLQLATGPFRWNIIKREDRFGIRFRNLHSEALRYFTGIDRFRADTSWRVPAHLEAALNKSIFITNILGQISAQQSPGKLVFSLNGHGYSLDALDEGGEELFIVFGDATNDEATYPSGRFLYIKKPGADGQTVIDFNKSINPPCAFTKFATCPLPPPQNILPLPVTAGEKDFGHH